jgi:hypothetical protein
VAVDQRLGGAGGFRVKIRVRMSHSMRIEMKMKTSGEQKVGKRENM